MVISDTLKETTMSDTERGRIVDTIFSQAGKSFTASIIAHSTWEVVPTTVYGVVALMDCVTEVEPMPGIRRKVRVYQVTGSSPEACSPCYFNSGNRKSCTRAPSVREAPTTRRPSPWENYLKKCKEARTGHLTDTNGNPIVPIGRLFEC